MILKTTGSFFFVLCLLMASGIIRIYLQRKLVKEVRINKWWGLLIALLLGLNGSILAYRFIVENPKIVLIFGVATSTAEVLWAVSCALLVGTIALRYATMRKR